MTQLSSHQFPQVYADLGVSIPDLGCIMLDVESFDVTRHVANGEADLYYGTLPQLRYAQGAVAEKSAHVTLLYGLLEPGPAWQKHVDAVLEGWNILSVRISDVSFFPSTAQNEDYSVIVAKIEVSAELLEGHRRLQLLPHVDTFPDYTPHLTLAYIKNGPSGVEWAESALEKWLTTLSPLEGVELSISGINYGGN